MTKRLHNPKSHAPAVYIPCWLIQIPVTLLSHGAKLVYGRLSQWCNETGHSHRSAPQLSQELGMCISSIKKFQKELRDVGLIGTYHPQVGGMNHFEFYDHPWMHEPINEHLSYKQDKFTPVYDHTLPRVSSYTTPVYDHTPINNKEIKEIKDNIYIPDFEKSGSKVKGKKSLKDYKKDPRFMSFYDPYPKKEDPQDAYKAFLSVVGDDDELLELIIADIENRKKNHSRWKDKQYIKHPAVYLRKGEYLGEIFNAQEEIKQKSEESRLKNEQRLKQQEEMSRKIADDIAKNNISKQNDGVVYRKTLGQLKNKSSIRPSGLQNVREQLGMK